MVSASTSRANIFSDVAFLMLTFLFILHSSPAFSQEDIQVSPEAEAALEEELRYLRAETFFGAGTITYSWSHEPLLTSPTATNLPAGTYTVVVEDATESKDSVSITLTDPHAIVNIVEGTKVNIEVVNISLESLIVEETFCVSPGFPLYLIMVVTIIRLKAGHP